MTPNEFAIIIIESLKSTEPNTGSKLFNEVLKYKNYEEQNLNIYLFKVNSKHEFFNELNKIAIRVMKEKVFPILHLEMHGSDDGIRLSSDEFIEWKDVLIYFRKINIQLRNSLMILMSMCKGISAISCFDPDLRAPFLAIIGSIRDMSPNELLKCFDAFYDNYLFSFNYQRSLDAMNNELEEDKKAFFVIKSSDWFDQVLDSLSKKTFIKALMDHAVRFKNTKKEFRDKSLPEIYGILHQDLIMKVKKSKENKDHFLMLDLKPL